MGCWRLHASAAPAAQHSPCASPAPPAVLACWAGAQQLLDPSNAVQHRSQARHVLRPGGGAALGHIKHEHLALVGTAARRQVRQIWHVHNRQAAPQAAVPRHACVTTEAQHGDERTRREPGLGAAPRKGCSRLHTTPAASRTCQGELLHQLIQQGSCRLALDLLQQLCLCRHARAQLLGAARWPVFRPAASVGRQTQGSGLGGGRL